MHRYLLVVYLFILIGSANATGSVTKHAVKESAGAPSDPDSKSLRGNGMCFVQNKGQIIDMSKKARPDILFKGVGNGTDIYLRKTGISYVLNNMGEVLQEIEMQLDEAKNKKSPVNSGRLLGAEEQKLKQELVAKQTLKLHRIDVDFVNANTNAETITKEKVEGYSNFYLGHCPQGVTGVNSFNEVTVKNIYHNIDVKYYGGKAQGLKYDIVINPGGNPDDVKLKYSGAKIKLESSKLTVESSLGTIGEYMPKVYQNINGKIVDVKAEYSLESLVHRPESNASDDSRQTTQAYIVSFKIGSFNSSFPLIIDPWATFYGGSLSDAGSDITTDNAGNVLVTGFTYSTDFPLSPGAFQTTYAGAGGSPIGGEGYIIKFTASGTRVFTTYVGGSLDDVPYAIAADLNGNVIITGYTYSTDYPTFDPGGGAYYQATNQGMPMLGYVSNPFISKFSATGSMLWSSYYGGKSNSIFPDQALGIATDVSGNIVITGVTGSTNFPVQAAYQSNLNGPYENAFVVKFNSGGVRQWATYYGGTSIDWGSKIACDASGDIFFCGPAGSSDFPVVAAYQPAAGGGGDGFLVKLKGSTGFPIWSTYYGGSGSDNLTGIAVDAAGNVIAAGITGSTSNIASPGAYQLAYGGAPYQNVFIVKFNSAGGRQWATYLGGSTDINVGDISAPTAFGSGCSSVATDASNNIYIYGEWEDKAAGNYPISTCAYQPSFVGHEEQFIAKYDLNGKQTCVTYMGGTGESDLDWGGGITVHDNSIYITGTTDGTYPVTAGAFQTAYGGASIGPPQFGDAFIAQLCTHLCEANVLNLNYSANSTNVCVNTPVTFTPAMAVSCDTSGMKLEWTFAGGIPSSSSVANPSVTYYTAGSYTVKLVLTTACKKDSVIKTSYITVNPCGCTMSAQANTISNISCGGANDGKASATISGGSGGLYTYSWSNGVTAITNSGTQQLNNLSVGNYTVTVTDGSCVFASTLSILPALQINSFTSTNPVCYGSSNGVVSVSLSGAAGPYSYSWSNGITASTATATIQFNNFSAGTYTVTVTENNCTLTSTVVLADPPFISLNNPIALWSCQNNAASATIVAALGSSPYSYSWSDGQVAQTAIGLNPGTYSVTVTDSKGCTASSSVIAKISPPLLADSSSQNISCSNIGYVGVGNVSGQNPISYSWSSGQASQSISGIAAGNYTLTVTDGSGCTLTFSYHITGNSTASASFTQSPAGTICEGTTVYFNNTGSSGAVIDRWWVDGVIQAYGSSYSQTFTSPGLYTIYQEIDMGGAACNAGANSIVKVVNCSSPSVTATSASICSGSCTTVTATPAGGNSPYTYLWSTGATTQTIDPCPLTNAVYTLTITDAIGATATTTSIVTVNSGINLTTTINNISCNGGNNGSVVANPVSGTSPFTYSWNNAQTTQTANGLAIGNYTVTVKDAGGCTGTTNVSVTQPSVLSITAGTITNASCGSSNGSASVSASGGTGTLTYSWSSTATSQTASNLSGATYTVTVTDANSCSKTASSVISNSGGPSIASVTANNPMCNAGTGTAVVAASGGIGALTYSWSASGGATGQTVNNLADGTYSVTVEDANSCSNVSTVTITSPAAISISASQNQASSCNLSNGIAVASATGGTGSLAYTWSSTASGITASNLAANTYSVTVTDGNSCAQTAVVIINNNPAPAITSLIPTNLSCNGSSDGSAMVNATGTGTLTYNWSTSATAATVVNLGQGTYTITVTDGNSCQIISTVTLTEPSIVSATVVSSNATCNLNNGTATLTSLSGGTGLITYTWSTGITTAIINNLAIGTYTLSATDANGCTQQFTTTVVNAPAGAVTTSVSAGITCNGLSTGSVSGIITGGTTPYSYSWSSGTTGTTIATQISATGLSAGTYVVTVSDATGCLGISTATITQPAVITLTAPTVTNATCGNSNGSVIATASGGSGLFTYSWSNGSTITTSSLNNSMTSLPASTYTLTVKDANGCTQSTTVTIINSNGPTAVTSVQSQINCFGGSGTAAVTASGGSAPYTYSWSTGASTVTSSLNNSITSLLQATYTITVIDANSCIIVSTITLTQPAALIATAASTPASCGGSNGIASAVVAGGVSTYTYSWSTGASTITSSLHDSITSLSSANYILTVTDANGCTETASTTIASVGAGVINITPATQTIVEGSTVAITVSGGSIYTWTPASGLSCTNCDNPVANPLTSTTYTVTTTDLNGCILTAELSITVKPACIGNDQDVFIANIFSPNGDGKNDVLYIEGNGLTNIYWAIYDRWGNLLFEAFDQSHGWDGTYKGNPMETGTYVYYLKATCIKTNTEVKLKGNVSIMK